MTEFTKTEILFSRMVHDVEYTNSDLDFSYRSIKRCSEYNKERNPMDVLLRIYEEMPDNMKEIKKECIRNVIDKFVWIPPEIYCTGWDRFGIELCNITGLSPKNLKDDLNGVEEWICKVWRIYANKEK